MHKVGQKEKEEKRRNIRKLEDILENPIVEWYTFQKGRTENTGKKKLLEKQ